jgi:hypothetical protein
VNAEESRCDACDAFEQDALNWWGFIRQGGKEIITDVTYQGVRIRAGSWGQVILSLG